VSAEKRRAAPKVNGCSPAGVGRFSAGDTDAHRDLAAPLVYTGRRLPSRIMNTSAKLIFLCGKMAAGKSTLARDLAERHNAIRLVQDEFLDKLFPGEITDIPGFMDRSSRLRNALTPHICALLSKGMSVVLDFPGNTKAQRAWFREIFERAQVEHELHFIDASDALCKRQLEDRSKHLPPGTPWTTEEEFEAITVYFQPPSVDEAFNVVRHERT
jgi:predicted kinase